MTPEAMIVMFMGFMLAFYIGKAYGDGR